MKVTTDACLFGAWVASEILQMESKPKRILDIGTGTGLLSLMIAQATNSSHIDAVESNEDAFQEASSNFAQSIWKDKLRTHLTSIQDYSAQEKYDLVICNPPFFKASLRGLDQNKNQALHSNDLSQKLLLDKVQPLLAAKGTFYLLYPEREMRIFQLFTESTNLKPSKRVSVRNTPDAQVFRVMIALSHRPQKVEESELFIRDGEGKYTRHFQELLKDYYLDHSEPET